MEEKVKALRQWMVSKGCLIHPSLEIPCNINGVQGIGTKAILPHKTLIMAIPSSLILTVSRCYNDPLLKKLFLANDDLFDYQSSQDCEFNVLCVFMMYHKLNIDKSEWKPYLETIAEPQTAIDWSNKQLKGLNKSIIEEIIHVRRQCLQLQNTLITYLMTRKQFSNVGEIQLRKIFTYCYRSVMTRCFGYYFSESCLIPVADLINHGCEVVNHQLININYETKNDFKQDYSIRKDKIDCSLINLQKPQVLELPFRQKFLIQNRIIQNQTQEKLATLNRKSIDQYLYKWNQKRFKRQECNLENLYFCSEDQEEDNDTDEQFEVEQVREMQNCERNEKQQMTEFMKSCVQVQKYGTVQKKLQNLKKQAHEHVDKKIQEIIHRIAQNSEGQSGYPPLDISQQIKNLKKLKQELIQQQVQDHDLNRYKRNIRINQAIQEETCSEWKGVGSTLQQQKIQKQQTTTGYTVDNVPIQMIDSQSEQQQGEDVWGLRQGAYFTMSTSSAVNANSELYNSYGSRTNKFLLVWYGFAYENNLHDSVSFRLQVKFEDFRAAGEIVLDSYIGGMGISFKKNENQVVRDIEVSRQFRLKRSNISEKLLIFLRLYLMNYYKGEDLYKLFVTFPASVNYELFVFRYYRDVVISLYSRYPLQVIQQLKQEYERPQFQSMKCKIKFKIIYLQEQRKLLDKNLKAVNYIIGVLQLCKANGGIIQKSMYVYIPIQIIRMIRRYLISYIKSMPYILYEQKHAAEQTIYQKNGQDIQLKEQNQDSWQQCDIEQEQIQTQQLILLSKQKNVDN